MMGGGYGASEMQRVAAANGDMLNEGRYLKMGGDRRRRKCDVEGGKKVRFALLK